MVTRSGVSFARSAAAGRRSLTVGQRRARERPQLVADDRRGLAQERPRLRAAPGRARARRAAAPAASGRAVASESVGLGQRASASRPEHAGQPAGSSCAGCASWSAKARRPRWRSRRTRRSGRPWWPARSTAAGSCGSRAREVRWRLASRPLILARSRAVGSKRRKVAERFLPLPRRPCPAPPEQQPQVVARVAVERRQDLVGVDVGQRVLDRDRRVLLHAAGRREPGVSSRIMSLRPVFGRSSIDASR